MNLMLLRDGHGLNGQASSYRIELPDGDKALLAVSSNRGWDLSIQTDKGKVIHRGLFGSTHDAVMLLEAEYYLLSDFVIEQIGGRLHQAVGSNRVTHR